MRRSVALDLHKFYQRIIRDTEPKFGMQFYTFHSPGKIYEFKRPEEIKVLANKIAKSELQKRLK